MILIILKQKCDYNNSQYSVCILDGMLFCPFCIYIYSYIILFLCPVAEQLLYAITP